MSNICAGIGRGQMQVLPMRIRQRRANFDFYNKMLSGIPGIHFTAEPDGRFFSNRWLTTILVDKDIISAEEIRESLVLDNIDCRPLWKPMHLQPVFQGMPFYGDHTSQRLFEKGLCLPSGSNLTDQDLNRIVYSVRQVIEWKKTVQQLTSHPVSL